MAPLPHSSKAKAADKPSRPPGFPLFAHRTKRWCKKIRGRFFYFGPWADPDAALAKYNAQKDDLLAGRVPRRNADGFTVADLCNHFLTHKHHLLQAGELADRTFATYYATCERLFKVFGKQRLVDDLASADFERLRAQIAAAWGPVALSNEVQRVRSVFRFGFEAGLLDKAVRFGPTFKKPSAKVLRQNRARRGPRMFEREELLAALQHAGVNMRAMLLLAINAALGNTEIALLPITAIDLERGWLNYARPKTGVPRRVPLWEETAEALREVLASRPEPKDPAERPLLFIGPRRESYVGRHRGYRVAQEMKRLLDKAGLNRKGLSFCCLRHGFQTIGEGARDLAAVQSLMGHAPAANDMSAVYRERVDDERLLAVTAHVHKWLFGA